MIARPINGRSCRSHTAGTQPTAEPGRPIALMFSVQIPSLTSVLAIKARAANSSRSAGSNGLPVLGNARGKAFCAVKGLRGQAKKLNSADIRNAVFPLHGIPQILAALA
jgi:hypothetical protein